MAAKENVPVTIDLQAVPKSDDEMYGILEKDATFIPADRADFLTESRASRDLYSRIKAAESIVTSTLTSEQKLTMSRTSPDGSQLLTLTRRGTYFAAIFRNFPFEMVAKKVLSVRLELFKKVVKNLGGLEAYELLPGHYRYPRKVLNEPNFIPRCGSGFIQRVINDLQQQAKSKEFFKDLKAAEQRTDFVLKKMVAVIRNLFDSYAVTDRHIGSIP